MIPSPAELQYFVEVANTLNISRASERLGISQPSLSLAIQRLEASFGIPLLIRSKSGVRLTKGGQRLVSQARLLLDEWDKVRADALRDENQISGRYTLGCHPSVGLYSLPGFLPALIGDNPALEFKLVHDLSRKITEDVISFKVDFGIVVNPTEHPDLVIKLLCEDEVTFWTGRGSSPIQDPFSGEGVLICDPELVQTQTLQKQLAKRGMKFRRTVTSGSLEVITALAAEGAGIAILPSRVATRIKAHGLKPVDADVPTFHDRVCLIYRADAQKSKTSRHIARSIEASFGKGGARVDASRVNAQ